MCTRHRACDDFYVGMGGLGSTHNMSDAPSPEVQYHGYIYVPETIENGKVRFIQHWITSCDVHLPPERPMGFQTRGS